MIAAAVVLLAAPSPADAAVPCGDADWAWYFDGVYEQPASSAYAARATIRERNIALCSNASGVTAGALAWTMLTDSTYSGYAQIGYAEYPAYTTTRRFWEYNDGEGWWNRLRFADIAAGTDHVYEVVYSFTYGTVGMLVDGSLKQTTPFSIEFGEWPTPWQGQWMGETWDRGDDVPGTSTAKARFGSVGVVVQRAGPYVNPRNVGTVQSLTVYKFQWVSQPTVFNIWTQR
ncbi:MAG: hypothetical protein JW785_03780 [Acidimicrobiia bacterium]|nr:hypothetical protein [Acidimicrobiia bacterium]